MEEAALILSAQEGSTEAFSRLVVLHQARVRAFVSRFVREDDVADDLAQEVFISAFRSMKDWRAALANPKTNPLRGCDSRAIQHFTRSLKFNNGGLAHADYSEVAKQLTYPQFKALWARFGLGMRIFADHEGYRCESRGTCIGSLGSICTSNC